MIIKAEQFKIYLFWERHGFKDALKFICLILSIILDSETLKSYFY